MNNESIDNTLHVESQPLQDQLETLIVNQQTISDSDDDDYNTELQKMKYLKNYYSLKLIDFGEMVSSQKSSETELVQDSDGYCDFEDVYFDLALFDEASMLKNPKSTRSLSARRLDVGVTVAMSGSPVENSLMDAWALTDLVFEGFFGGQESFKSRYVHSDLSETLDKNLEELESSLRQITLRRMKKDALLCIMRLLQITRKPSNCLSPKVWMRMRRMICSMIAKMVAVASSH